jgi:hypothetical protein
MSSFDDTQRRKASGQPTGIPEEPLDAVSAINAELGRRVNLPGPEYTGVLLAGVDSQNVAPLAQVSIALSLADIAASLRKLTARDGA